ncbi:MAG: hypothetical protein C4576_35390 [Desulfobacteraceae bacterium]|nr:MAG: hypothetical protein C4576_35390 [Desulfobacteraceae bacterium]
MSVPEIAASSGQKTKVAITLSLCGRPLARVELSALEFEEIRNRPPEEAVNHLIRKARLLREEPLLCAELLSRLRAHMYRVREE